MLKMETRKIDGLGRVTIPKSIRKQAKIQQNDVLKIEFSQGKIIMTPITENVIAINGVEKRVDDETLQKIKNFLESEGKK